jgi:hypothetical protein
MWKFLDFLFQFFCNCWRISKIWWIWRCSVSSLSLQSKTRASTEGTVSWHSLVKRQTCIKSCSTKHYAYKHVINLPVSVQATIWSRIVFEFEFHDKFEAVDEIVLGSRYGVFRYKNQRGKISQYIFSFSSRHSFDNFLQKNCARKQVITFSRKPFLTEPPVTQFCCYAVPSPSPGERTAQFSVRSCRYLSRWNRSRTGTERTVLSSCIPFMPAT